MSQRLERLARFVWDAIPARAGRAWRALGTVMSDGRYLMAWPKAAALLPVAAIVAGFATGGFRPVSDEIFTMSIAWPIVLLAFGALGAGIGVYAWLGFVIGDLFVFPHISWETELPVHLLKETLPLLIVYQVLLGLAVLLPLAARSLPESLVAAFAGRSPSSSARFATRLVLADVVAALTALSWAASVQLLIRPLATFHGGVLGPTAIQPMREQGILFVAVAVLVTSLRVVLESLAPPVPAVAMPPAPRPRSGRAMRLGRTALVSLLVALGLSGLLDSPYDLGQDLILFGSVFIAAVLRTMIVPAIPRYAALVNRIPVMVRIVAIGVLGGGLGQIILSATSLQGSLQSSFLPILVAVAIGMVVTALVIPSSNPAERQS